MIKSTPYNSASFGREFAFQVLLHLLVFVFYAIDRRHPEITAYEATSFLNVAIAAFLFNYALLPRLLYEKKYLYALTAITLTIVTTVLVEEFILEKIFFPTTRGTRFAGVFYTLIGILPAFSVLVGFKFAWETFGKQRELEELQVAIRESELQFLKSQVNPHFLFNNLNNLYAHAIERSPRTPDIILELSAVLRYMLYDCRAAYVPLSKEVEHLKNFIKISELQIEERGEVKFSVDGNMDNYKVAPLLLVVFVENAFKHSTASQAENIRISVSLRMNKEGVLFFSCVNSFREQSNVDQLGGGIGLENVCKRLELLYPNAHELQIEKGVERYSVFLSIHLNEK